MGSSGLPPSGQPKPMQAGEFASQSHGPRVVFITDEVAPPSRVYVTRDDTLVVQVTDLNQAGHVQITARLLTADGVIVPIQSEFSGGPFLTARTTQIALTEGFLLSLSVVSFNTTQRGTTFVRAWLNRGTVSALNAAQLLIADYVTTGQIAAWPDARLMYPTEGPGQLFSNNIVDPAAGAEWTSTTVQGSSRWRLVCGSGQLVTSASVANRGIGLFIKDGAGNRVWVGSAAATVPASQTVRINFASGVPATAVVGGQVQLALPYPCILPVGFTFGSLTQNLQAGDAYTGFWVLLEQWVDQV